MKTSLLSHLLIISIDTIPIETQKAGQMTVTIQSILDADNRISPYKIETALLSSDRLNQKLPFLEFHHWLLIVEKLLLT